MALQFEIIPVTPFQQNCTLQWCDQTNEAVLTDVGGSAPEILAYIQEKGLNLVGVWLTHGHVDHVSGVVNLLEHHKVPVLGPHKDDDFWIQQLPQITKSYQFPISPVFTPDSWLEEGEQLQVGHETFEVIYVPGHTPGHVVFYSAKNELLIAGDVLFKESIGRTDFPRGNHADLIHNIKTKLWALPDSTRVIPGHGPMTTIGHEKKHNPFLR